MNAARRAPRAHGMTVSFFAAVATILLMKRVLVFMALILDLSVVGVCPCLRLNMTQQSVRFLAGLKKSQKNRAKLDELCGPAASFTN